MAIGEEDRRKEIKAQIRKSRLRRGSSACYYSHNAHDIASSKEEEEEEE